MIHECSVVSDAAGVRCVTSCDLAGTGAYPQQYIRQGVQGNEWLKLRSNLLLHVIIRMSQ
jgi:hypothetical protein